MTISNLWKKFKNKQVRMMIRDGKFFPKPRDGIFKDIDSTHIFLEITEDSIPTPFLREEIKRVELRE